MFGLYARIAAAIALAALLAGLYWRGYTQGAKAVRLEWDAAISQQTADALKASEDARRKEAELTEVVQKVSVQYATAKRDAAIAARGAGADLERLRDALSASASPAACENPASPSGNHGTGGSARELLGSCATAFAGMAQEADRLAARVLALQGYARDVCLQSSSNPRQLEPSAGFEPAPSALQKRRSTN